MDITTYVIVVTVISFLISIVVDYILFRIWHYYAHSDRNYDRYSNQRPSSRFDKIKTNKKKNLDKQLRKAGYNPKDVYKEAEKP